METTPLISVIVPVYRAEKYLERCVKSILNQTYKNLEVILVDGGSPDNCPALCDKFAEADRRVKVIHKQNGGVAEARNSGLDAVTGDYITFVDSDDYIDSVMYENMTAKVTEHNCDVVLCDCVKDSPDKSEVYTHNIRAGFYDEEQLKNEYYPHLLMMENVEYPATISNCLCLFKNKPGIPRYESGIRFSEDLLFGTMLMKQAESFYYMKGENYYHYFMNPDSATHNYASDKWNDYVKLHSKIKEYFWNDSEFDFKHQVDLCLLFFIYNAAGETCGADNLTDNEKLGKIRYMLDNSEVREMFKRLKISALPISQNLKIVTYFYKYKIGIKFLIGR